MKYFFVTGHTAFVPLRDIYPECAVLIQGEPQLYPLICMRTACPRNANCPQKLAHRVNFFFEKVADPDVTAMIAYFKHEDRPGSVRAGVFFRDMREPRVIVCNHYAFRKFKRDGEVFKWDPTDSFYQLGAT